MTKLANRILIAIVAWLGLDSAMDQKGKALGIVDMNRGGVTIIHHRAVVGTLGGWVRSKLPRRFRSHGVEAIEAGEPIETTGHPSPMEMIASMGMPGQDEVEQFETYLDFINEHGTHPTADQVVVDHANASNRSLLDLMGIDVTQPDVMRALMFACFSVSMESHKIQHRGIMMPLPYVISDGLAMSFVQTAEAIERGKLPDDIVDPEDDPGA